MKLGYVKQSLQNREIKAKQPSTEWRGGGNAKRTLTFDVFYWNSIIYTH